MPEIARLDHKHAEAMHSLERQCFTLPWTKEQCLGALAQKCFKAFGILDNGNLLAYASFYHAQAEMEIVNIAVHPEWRRRGFARELLAILLQAALKMGIEKVALEVRESNFAARALYAQAGFQQTGIRKKYYPDTGEDGLVLTRDIIQSMAAPAAGETICKK